MGAKSAVICLIFLLSSADGDVMVVDTDIIESAQAEFESHESQISKTGLCHCRLRLVPEGRAAKWHFRYESGADLRQWGIRLDHAADDTCLVPASLYAAFRLGSIELTAGSLKIETGQGLLFGSQFGRTLSAAGHWSFMKDRMTARAALHGADYGCLTGILSGTENVILFSGVSQSAAELLLPADSDSNQGMNGCWQTGAVSVWKKAAAQLKLQVLYETGLRTAGQSRWTGTLCFNVIQPRWSLSGETALERWCWILNLRADIPGGETALQLRCLPDRWQPAWGTPAAALGTGTGERAVYWGLNHRNPFIEISTSFHTAKEWEPEAGSFAQLESEWSLEIRPLWRKGAWLISYRMHRQTELQTNLISGLEFSEQHPRTKMSFQLTGTVHGKPEVVLKFCGTVIRHEHSGNQTGYLIGARQNWCKVWGLDWQSAVYLYRTSDWESRFYGGMGGFAGEFRIRPLAGTGCEGYVKTRWKIDSGCSLDFRFGWDWNLESDCEQEFNGAMQLNYRV